MKIGLLSRLSGLSRLFLMSLFLCLMSMCLIPTAGYTLGFGEVRLYSHLDEPLEAEIELLGAEHYAPEHIIVALASEHEFKRAGLIRSPDLSQMKFQIIRNNALLNRIGRGIGTVIRVTSTEPIKQPYLEFLMDLSWPQGRLVRGYTLELDLMHSVLPSPSVKKIVSKVNQALDPRVSTVRMLLTLERKELWSLFLGLALGAGILFLILWLKKNRLSLFKFNSDRYVPLSSLGGTVAEPSVFPDGIDSIAQEYLHDHHFRVENTPTVMTAVAESSISPPPGYIGYISTAIPGPVRADSEVKEKSVEVKKPVNPLYISSAGLMGSISHFPNSVTSDAMPLDNDEDVLNESDEYRPVFEKESKSFKESKTFYPPVGNEMSLKLDLARHYFDLGEDHNAFHLLEDVLARGTEWERQTAQKLLDEK